MTLSTHEKLHCKSLSLWCRLLYDESFLHLIWDIRASVISHDDDTGSQSLIWCTQVCVLSCIDIIYNLWWTCASSRLSQVSKHLPSTHSPLSSHSTKWRRWMLPRNEREKMLFLNSWDFHVSKHWPLIYLFKWVLSLYKKHALAHNSIPQAPIRRFKEA